MKQISLDWDININTLSNLKSGAIDHVSRGTLDKILKGMNMYYEFYCEETMRVFANMQENILDSRIKRTEELLAKLKYAKANGNFIDRNKCKKCGGYGLFYTDGISDREEVCSCEAGKNKEYRHREILD